MPTIPEYKAHGWVVIPIPTGSKAPNEQDWQTGRIIAPDDWPGNVGLLHHFSGTIALDVDNFEKADAFLSSHGISLTALLSADDAVQIRSGQEGRAKLLYAAPEGCENIGSFNGSTSVGLEIRANGQDVLPPSIHPSGRPYTWAGLGDWQNLPEMPEALKNLWLRLKERKSNPAPSVQRQANNVDMDTLIKAMRVLAKAGWVSDYHQWLTVGMALHHEGLPLDLWDKWSRLCPEKYDPNACPTKWNSFTDSTAKPVTIASLLHEARQILHKEEIEKMFKRPEGDTARLVDNEWPANPVLRDSITDITKDMVPDVIWNYANDCADLLGISVSAVAMPAIVGIAALIHDRIKIQPKRYDTSWTESARLWAAVIGDPSARKSPAMAKALAPMQAINKRLVEAYHRENDIYQALVGRAKKDKSIEVPDKPVKHRIVVEDTTVEALGEVLKENPRGVLVVHDELSGWIGSFDSYASDSKGVSRDRGYWLQAYNGGPITVNRIVRGEVYIPNFSCSIIGGIQPEVIRTVAKGMGHDGLLQRFMLFNVSSTGLEKDREPDSHAAAKFTEVCEWIAALESNATGPVILCDEAHTHRESVAKAAHWGTTNTAYPMALRGHLGKWTGLYARLLLAFHVVECAKVRVYPNEMAVSEQTAIQVANLMFDFIGPNAEGFYRSVFASKLSEHIAKLAGWLLTKRAESVATRDIARNNSFWRTLEQRERIEVMSALVDCGWVCADNDIGVRSLSTRWLINPDIYDGRFDALRVAEEKRRKDYSAKLVEHRKRKGT